MTGKKWFLCSMALLLALSFPSWVVAQKLIVATMVRAQPEVFVPIMAAEEKGFWKEQGLAAEWSPFISSGAMLNALAAGSIGVGLNSLVSSVGGIGRGVPAYIGADLETVRPWFVWVKADSPFREIKDLKGKRIGIGRFGATMHAYTQAFIKGVGLEKDVRLVATGGLTPAVAALRSGVVEAIILTYFAMANLEHEGVARKIVSLSGYVPVDLDGVVVMVSRSYEERRTEETAKAIKGVLRGGQFAMANADWAVATIKKEMGWPEGVAKEVYKILRYSADGRIRKSRLATMRNFMIEYELIRKEKAPPVEQLLTPKFVPVE